MVPADDVSTEMLRMASDASAVLRDVMDYAIYLIDVSESFKTARPSGGTVASDDR